MNYAIGIDIGGTKISGGIVNSNGKVLHLAEHETEAEKGCSKVIDNISFVVSSLKRYAQKKKIKLKGIGIGAPGFTMKNGKRTSIENIPGFMDYKLEYYLKKRFQRFSKNIAVQNDANCFALAENKFGSAKKQNIIGIIDGTGLGVGLILDGKLYQGAGGGAGELNHSLFCAGKNHNFGYFCSGKGIETIYKEKTKIQKTAKEIFNSKGKLEKKLIKDLHHHLALFLSYIINLLEPEIIAVGGGLSISLDYKRLNSLVKKFKYEGIFMPKIIKSMLNQPGVIGAASLVL